MTEAPRDPRIKELWEKQQKLYAEARLYEDAIRALQKLCAHPHEKDVSYHGTPQYECPDCGSSR
jgi:hypothetical protein